MIYTLILLFVALLGFVLPQRAYAAVGGATEKTMTNNGAIQDIMSGTRYQGIVEGISVVTYYLDYWFSCFIAIVAWFIMSSAMLKNVIAGAYAANPNLWDKVHDSKLALMDAVESKTRGSKVSALGTLTVWILSWLPDFKELSDFKEDNVRPKDYFLKAIPQMVGAVMISVFIYNGYYRDFMVKVASLGCELIERFLLDVDFIEVYDRLTNSIGSPDLASEQDDSDRGQLQYAITKEMYSQTVSYWSDIRSSDAKNKVATTLESWVAQQVNSCGEYATNGERWKASFAVKRVVNEPDLTTIQRDDTDTSEYVVRAFSYDIAQLGLDSKLHNDEHYYYRVIITFTKKRQGVTSTGTMSNIQLNIPTTDVSTSDGNGDKHYLYFPNCTNIKITKSAFTINGEAATWDENEHKATWTQKNFDASQPITLGGVKYSSNGIEHTISSVSVGGSGTEVTLHAPGTGQTINPGETFKTEFKKDAEDEETTETENSSNNTKEKDAA